MTKPDDDLDAISVVLRDYRNYVHPAKELSEGVTIDEKDIPLLWTVFTGLTDQVLKVT